MEINSPEQLMAAIKLLLVQMNRKQRVQFLHWVKRTKNEYDFNYPEGKELIKKESTNEPVSENVVSPVISVPDTRIVDVKGNPLESSDVRTIVPSSEGRQD